MDKKEMKKMASFYQSKANQFALISPMNYACRTISKAFKESVSIVDVKSKIEDKIQMDYQQAERFPSDADRFLAYAQTLEAEFNDVNTQMVLSYKFHPKKNDDAFIQQLIEKYEARRAENPLACSDMLTILKNYHFMQDVYYWFDIQIKAAKRVAMNGNIEMYDDAFRMQNYSAAKFIERELEIIKSEQGETRGAPYWAWSGFE